MKVRALKVFGDGRRNYAEGEIAEMEPEIFEKVNATPNGVLCELVSEKAEVCEEVPDEEITEVDTEIKKPGRKSGK